MENSENSNSHKTVGIVGGGLGGTLCACYFAKHGFKVHLFELRSDIRKQKVVKGRSINMALSVRGRHALNYIDCEDIVVNNGIPMHSRMLHDVDCHTHPVPYGTRPEDQIISIDRRILNEILLNEASKKTEITIHFQYKFHNWDRSKKTATFENEVGDLEDFELDALIGYDGCYSGVRRSMLKLDLVNYSQTYIETHYMEFCIPAKDNDFAIANHHLHIWPRHDFMLIALPNQDKSFTTTLFLPLKIFESLTDNEKLLEFFQKYFPDAISLIGKESLIDTFFSSKPLPLISIKCSPHASACGDILLMGDAAHSMCPFYAQGMNSAFEDTTHLFEKLRENNFDVPKAFLAYNETRVDDLHAIVDLSMYNYIEMRHLVTQRSFYWRKKLDNFLYRLMPNRWIPLYTMVTFTRIPYRKCMELRKKQDDKLRTARNLTCWIGAVLFSYPFTIFVLKPLIAKLIAKQILPVSVVEKIL